MVLKKKITDYTVEHSSTFVCPRNKIVSWVGTNVFRYIGASIAYMYYFYFLSLFRIFRVRNSHNYYTSTNFFS